MDEEHLKRFCGGRNLRRLRNITESALAMARAAEDHGNLEEYKHQAGRIYGRVELIRNRCELKRVPQPGDG